MLNLTAVKRRVGNYIKFCYKLHLFSMYHHIQLQKPKTSTNVYSRFKPAGPGLAT